MGIRSDVVLDLTKDSFKEYVKFIKENGLTEEDKEFALGHTLYEDSETVKIWWEWVKWYEFDPMYYPDVDLVERAVDFLGKEDLPYHFLKICPECDHSDERCNKLEEIPNYSEVVFEIKTYTDGYEIKDAKEIENLLKEEKGD